MQKLFFIPFIFLSVLLSAQEKGISLVEIWPKDAFLKIDGEVIDISKKEVRFELEKKLGDYPIEIWAPGYEVVNDEISFNEIPSGYGKKLKTRTPNYLAYRKQMYEHYKRIGFMGALIGVNAAGLIVVYDVKTRKELSDLRNYTEDLRMEQVNLVAATELERNRAKFDEAKLAYESLREGLYKRYAIGFSTVALSSIGSAFIIKSLMKKNKIKPIFESEDNPFVLEDLKINMGENFYSFQAIYKF